MVDRGTCSDRNPERTEPGCTVSSGMCGAGRALRRRRSLVYNFGEFAATAMNLSINRIRAGTLFMTFLGCAASVALGQDSPAQPLGDVARKTRQERSPSYVPA